MYVHSVDSNLSLARGCVCSQIYDQRSCQLVDYYCAVKIATLRKLRFIYFVCRVNDRNKLCCVGLMKWTWYYVGPISK